MRAPALERLHRQRLLPGSEAAGAVEAAAAVCGLQAQDAPSTMLSVRARTSGLTAADVEHARSDRSLVRTWAMRGTLHLLAASDVPWLVPLVAAPALPAQRSWFPRSGHDVDVDALVASAVEVLEAAGPLTRVELAERLGRPGEGDVAHAAARLASQQGLVCLGPERGRDATYVGVRRWLGPAPPPPSDPLAELARRYRAGHAHATAEDLAAWSGLGLRDCRRAFELVKDEVEESRPASPVRFVRLVPRWDSVLLGWKGRDWLVTREHAAKVLPGGGYLHAVVIVDGRAAGTWKLVRGRVVADWFGREPRGIKRALAAEEEDLLRFLAQD